MQMGSSWSVFLAASAILACGSVERYAPMTGEEPDGTREASATEIPEGWVRVEGACGIGLSAPKLIAVPAQGADTCVAKFESGTCTYLADLGHVANPLDSPDYDTSAYAIERVRVEGHSGRLVRSVGRDEFRNFFAGLHVPSIWGESSPGVTIMANCGSEEAQETARRVLQTLTLPDDAQAAARALSPPADCAGYDQRPIRGFVLGESIACNAEKVVVPGACAVGAMTHDSIGTGDMLCFADTDGSLYWAFVAFGEHVLTTGARHGGGELWRDELEPTEAARCTQRAEALRDAEGASFAIVSGEYIPPPCE